MVERKLSDAEKVTEELQVEVSKIEEKTGNTETAV